MKWRRSFGSLINKNEKQGGHISPLHLSRQLRTGNILGMAVKADK